MTEDDTNILIKHAVDEGMTTKEFVRAILEATADIFSDHLEVDGEPFEAALTASDKASVCKISVSLESIPDDETTP